MKLLYSCDAASSRFCIHAPGTCAKGHNLPLPEGWNPDTYGARYLRSLEGMSVENLERRRIQLDEELTFSIEAECRRMVCVQAVEHALKAVQS